MTRAALLVAVLAALCYTSQAIPVQTENAQVELPNVNIDELLKIVKEKVNDLINKWENYMGDLEYEAQVAKFESANRLQEELDKIKKLLEKGEITLKEFLEKIKEIKQKIKPDYELSLSVSTKLLKPIIKIIGKEVLAPIVKGKIQDMLNKRRTYGIKENMGGILKNIGEKVDKIVGEGTKILTDKLDELVEIGKELENTLEEMVDATIEDAKKIADNVKDKLKDMKNTITGEKYQQPQQAIILDGVGGLVEKITGGAGDVINRVGDMVKEIGEAVNEILNIPDNLIKGLGNKKGEKKPEDGKKTDKNEEKENNIEVPEENQNE